VPLDVRALGSRNLREVPRFLALAHNHIKLVKSSQLSCVSSRRLYLAYTVASWDSRPVLTSLELPDSAEGVLNERMMIVAYVWDILISAMNLPSGTGPTNLSNPSLFRHPTTTPHRTRVRLDTVDIVFVNDAFVAHLVAGYTNQEASSDKATIVATMIDI
jgi:hypothetical protein